jgi:hypothetical protein
VEKLTYSFTELFKQLGLPHNHEALESFLKLRQPFNVATRLEGVSFWSPSQRDFIKEQLCIDADWSELIDQLSLGLR